MEIQRVNYKKIYRYQGTDTGIMCWTKSGQINVVIFKENFVLGLLDYIYFIK